MGVLTVLAMLSLVAGYQIQPTPAHTNQPFRMSLLWEHFGQLKDVCASSPSGSARSASAILRPRRGRFT